MTTESSQKTKPVRGKYANLFADGKAVEVVVKTDHGDIKKTVHKNAQGDFVWSQDCADENQQDENVS